MESRFKIYRVGNDNRSYSIFLKTSSLGDKNHLEKCYLLQPEMSTSANSFDVDSVLKRYTFYGV